LDDALSFDARESLIADTLPHYTANLATGTTLYRARIGPTEADPFATPKPYSGADIGANPKHPAARANLEGQPIFYCSQEARTAITEVRPGVGQYVSVGDFSVIRNTTIIDLCQNLEPQNPFTLQNLPQLLDVRLLLRSIARFMSVPTKPGEDETTYTATQHFANLLRACGYDGLRYPSSLGVADGFNIGLFDPNILVYKRSRLVQITAVHVEFSPFESDTNDRR
jgi:hypothetical protein